jgi:hypothetical protein
VGCRPGWIGPVEFEQFGAKWVAVRCPSEVPRWRINPLMRELRRATDPLLRRVGMDLDGEGN